MARSVWKGPFVEESLIKKVEKSQKINQTENQLKLGQENQLLFQNLLVFSFLIYNGKKFIPLTISEDMVGHKLGEFAPTRTFLGIHQLIKKQKNQSQKKRIQNNMSKKKKLTTTKIKLVKSINKNVRSSTRKLNPILKAYSWKKS